VGHSFCSFQSRIVFTTASDCAGPDPKYVYVSYNRADALFLEELKAQGRGISRPLASKGQILGHVFAHEMGHILLNTANHSPSWIMRGVWDVNTWSDAFSGKMLFSAEQGKILRAEVLKRAAQQEGTAVDGEEMARLIR
jgi:hypothetical protein